MSVNVRCLLLLLGEIVTVCSYIFCIDARFLTHLNEENSTLRSLPVARRGESNVLPIDIRVLYERAVTAMPPEKAVDVGFSFLRFLSFSCSAARYHRFGTTSTSLRIPSAI